MITTNQNKVNIYPLHNNTWTHRFSWGDMIPGSSSKLSKDCVDFLNGNLILSTRREECTAFLYKDTQRIEYALDYLSGAFITNEAFAFGTFTFELEIDSVMGYNVVAGLFEERFSESIIGFKYSRNGSILDYFCAKSSISIGNNTMFGNYKFIKRPNRFKVTIVWIPKCVSVYINDKLVIDTRSEDMTPKVAMHFGVITSVNSEMNIPHNSSPKVVIRNFKYDKL